MFAKLFILRNYTFDGKTHRKVVSPLNTDLQTSYESMCITQIKINYHVCHFTSLNVKTIGFCFQSERSICFFIVHQLSV